MAAVEEHSQTSDRAPQNNLKTEIVPERDALSAGVRRRKVGDTGRQRDLGGGWVCVKEVDTGESTYFHVMKEGSLRVALPLDASRQEVSLCSDALW